MLRVLTLSTLFPNTAQPTLGLFVERQTQALAARRDVEVVMVAPAGLPVGPLSFHPHYRPLRELPARETWNGLTVLRPRYTVWPLVNAPATAGSLARSILPVLEQLRTRFPFDVIDAEYFWPDGPAAAILSRALNVPFSIKARGSDIYMWGDKQGIGDQILDAAYAAGGMLAVSASLKGEMVARGFPADRIRVHHTGVDLEQFKPVDRVAAKAALGLTGPVIACVGALIERKGQAYAVDALARLPGVTLLLIGDGEERGSLEKQARGLGLADRVRFMGARPPEEVAELVAAADVSMLPTRAEGIANAWVESLACGTPVVTCDAGGASEVIDRPQAGRVVTRLSSALADAAAELLEAPPAQEEVRRSAERFSWERNGEELEAHLREIASGRAEEPGAPVAPRWMA